MSHRSLPHGRSTTRDRVSLVFGFFLSLVLTCLGALLVARVAVLGKASLRLQLGDAYCRQVVGDVSDSARYYTIPTGLDAAVLDGVFDVGEVRACVDATLSAAFDGTAHEPDVSAAQGRLLANVELVLSADDGAELTSEASEAAQAYVADIMDIYRAGLRLPGLDELMSVRPVIVRALAAGAVVLALVAAGLLVAIVRLHHHPHRALRFVAVAVAAAALMCLVVPLLLLLLKPYVGLGLTPRHLYLLCVSLVEQVLWACLIVALTYGLLAVVLALVCTSMRRRALRRGLRHRARRVAAGG